MEICADREMVSRTVNHMTCCSRSAIMRWNVRGSGFRNLLIVCFFFTTALCCACAQLQKVLEEEEGHHLTCDNPRLFVICMCFLALQCIAVVRFFPNPSKNFAKVAANPGCGALSCLPFEGLNEMPVQYLDRPRTKLYLRKWLYHRL